MAKLHIRYENGDPERVIELAVKGMLPKSKLGKAMAEAVKELL